MDENFKKRARDNTTTPENLISEIITLFACTQRPPILDNLFKVLSKHSNQSFSGNNNDTPLPNEIIREIQIFQHINESFQQIIQSLHMTADSFIRKIIFTIVNSPNHNVIISPELRDKTEKLIEEASTESENSNSSELNETQMKNYQNCENYIFI